MIEDSIMDVMNTIEYGFLDEFGNNIINDTEKWNNEFYDFYYLLDPEELLEKKVGICWDQVELERKLFNENSIENETFFIYSKDGNLLPSHTFLTYKNDNKYYWFEHSWDKYKGIHEYNNLNELLIDVRGKFVIDNNIKDVNNTYIFQYERPKYNINCDDFYRYCESQKYIELKE